MIEQTTAGGPTRLEDLKAGLKLSGLLPEPVSILAVTTHGPDAVTVTFQDVNGTLGQRLLYRADEAALSIESPTTRWRFDADPFEFRLGESDEAPGVNRATIPLTGAATHLDPVPPHTGWRWPTERVAQSALTAVFLDDKTIHGKD
jgi:hypothetical protein